MPNVNPKILIWARKSAGLSVEEASIKLQLTDSKTISAVDKLLAFESQEKDPSRSLLVKMAKLYKKPLLTLYMEEQPLRGDRGEDFRTLPVNVVPTENAYVDVLIRDIKARQSLLRETLIEEDEEQRLEFIGCADIKQGVSQVASSICESIKFDLNTYQQCQTTHDAFKYLRALAEDVGIFVLLIGNLGSHHTNISTSIFRGFVLSDEIAPFVVINDLDSKAAWSFTLLHEIAHLWLGQTGVSGAKTEKKVEKFCSDVASQILLPENELRNLKFSGNVEFIALTEVITSFARDKNVSSALVSYRLYRKGIVTHDLWLTLNEHFDKQWFDYRDKTRNQKKQKEGGPSYFVVRRHSLGEALIRFTERMTSSGVLTPTRAGFLLGVRPLKVHKIFELSNAV